MTEQSDILIKHEPLRNLLGALADEDERTDVSVAASLSERGFDPEAIVAAAHATVQQGLKKQRLAWQEQARANLTRLQSARASVDGWVQRNLSEVEDAFGKVVQGVFGPAAQMRVQVAFRHLDKVTPEDKASFLDDLEALDLLSQDEPSDEDT